MKKNLLPATALALAISAGSAFAADLPSHKAPPYIPPPPPLMTWTGFYVGVNAGYTFGGSNNVLTASAPFFAAPITAGGSALRLLTASAAGATGAVPVNSDGFIGGGQIGYNWQFANRFVAGVEVDIQGVAGGGGTGNVTTAVGPFLYFGAPDSLVTSINSTKRLNYLGTVRGRLGFLLTPTLLVYGTGGLAYGGVSSSTSIAQINNDCVFFPGNCLAPASFASGSYSNSRAGWTVGGGGEWLFAPKWSAKLEYLYYDLGRATYASAPLVIGGGSFNPGGNTIVSAVLPAHTTRFNGHIIRAGINYHFLTPAPVPVYAKY